MIEFLLILIIGLGLWVLILQIDNRHLRMMVERHGRAIANHQKGTILLSERIGEDVRELKHRLDTLERD